MAKFYKHLNTIGLRITQAEERQFPVPAGATDVIVFDESTNQDVISAFNSDYNSHSLVGGVLSRNGTPVSFASDSPEKVDRDDFDTQLAAYYTAMQNYLAIADSATNAQVRDQVKRLTQGMVRVCKVVKQLKTLLEK